MFTALRLYLLHRCKPLKEKRQIQNLKMHLQIQKYVKPGNKHSFKDLKIVSYTVKCGNYLI